MSASDVRSIANDIFTQLTEKGLSGKQTISVVTEIIALITHEMGSEDLQPGPHD